MRSEAPVVDDCAGFAYYLSELSELAPDDLVAGTSESLGPRAGAARHLGTCLRCQAEVAQYRKLRRALAGLRHDLLVPGATLLDDVLMATRPPAPVARLRRGDGPTGQRNRRAAYIGGIAAAATGVTAGALVLASRYAARQRLAG